MLFRWTFLLTLPIWLPLLMGAAFGALSCLGFFVVDKLECDLLAAANSPNAFDRLYALVKNLLRIGTYATFLAIAGIAEMVKYTCWSLVSAIIGLFGVEWDVPIRNALANNQCM